MKRILLVVLVTTTLAIPAISSAAPPRQGPYASVFIGTTVPVDTDATGSFNDRISFDPGLNVGGSAGFDFGSVRLEGEISYKEAEIDTIYDKDTETTFGGIQGGIYATAFMANLFIDLHNPGPLTPYLGGGVGFAALHQDETYNSGTFFYEEDDDVVLAYQLGAGMEIELNRQLSLDLAYRYFRTSEASFVSAELPFESHNATVGLRLKY